MQFKMQLKKEHIIPVSILIIISLMGLFKLTPLGVIIDSTYAYFTGMIRYLIYILNIIIGLIYVIYKQLVTQKRLLSVTLLLVSLMIFSEIYVATFKGFTNLPTIGELISNYFNNGNMLVTGGGLIGLLIVTSLKTFISCVLAIILIGVAIILIIDKPFVSRKRSKVNSGKQVEKQKPSIKPTKVSNNKPVKKSNNVYDDVEPLQFSDDSNTLEIDNYQFNNDDPVNIDTNHESYVIEPEPKKEESFKESYARSFEKNEVFLMQKDLETVFDNYNLSLEFVSSEIGYNDQQVVAYEFKKSDNDSNNSLKPSELKQMKLDFEMALDLSDIQILIPFENRQSIGFVINGYDIKK